MADNAVIEIKACKTAAQEEGIADKAMLKLVADITQRKVIGYDDIYGPWPHGQEYIIHPDGTVTKGVKHLPYEGSWEQWFQNLRTNKDKKKEKIQGMIDSLPRTTRMDRLP